jgi:quercetin dioxygenase-like cupin family protein
LSARRNTKRDVFLVEMDTAGAYCLLEVGLAPGMMVPPHTHTREDEAYYILAGELEVTVGDDVFVVPDWRSRCERS